MNEKKFSQALLELSDAIEQLALLLAQQKQVDNKQIYHKLKVIHKYAKNNIESTDKSIRKKHKKAFIKNYLLEKNITTGKFIDNLHVDKKLYNIALYLVKHFHELEDFYKQLKRHQNIKKDFIAQTNKASWSYIKQWSDMLHKNKIIDAFGVVDAHKIDIDIAEIHKATLFINGNWLEIFLRAQIAHFMRKNIHKINSFDIMAQVQIQRPDHKTSELDLLLMINEKIYWFECKSGQIGAYYKRFYEHQNYLALPPHHSFLLVPQLHQNQSDAVYHKTKMKLIYATEMNDKLLSKIFNLKI